MEHPCEGGRRLLVKQKGTLVLRDGKLGPFGGRPRIEIAVHIENTFRVSVTPERALKVAADLILQATEIIENRE